MAPVPKDETHRFWDSVSIPPDVESGCWVWLRARDQDGYGLFRRGPRAGRKQVRAHRYSFEYVHGAVPVGLSVLHACNNPSCVNPTHLRAGTNLDNMADRKAAGHYAEGPRHKNVNVSLEVAQAIRADPRTRREVAKSFSVSPNTVYRIKSNKSHWSWRNAQ